jgi:hypothetical protein
MNTIDDTRSAVESESDQQLIASKMLKVERLQSIVNESIMEFLVGISQRTPLDIAMRIILLIGAIGLLIGSATFSLPSLIAFFALCGTLEAIRANRRIDALIELQGITNIIQSEQAVLCNPL